MKFIRNLTLFHSHATVATIGNFDGVHRGHQWVLQQLRQRATALQLPSVVIVFEPQPQEFFSPVSAPPRLTRLREKIMAIRHCGIDQLVCLRFNTRLASLSAEDFIQQILVKSLHIRHLVVGDDFHFGQKRQGNFNLLYQAGQHYGFTVENQHPFLLNGERVSSTLIRQALLAGDFSRAQTLIGRPYTICGRVRYGQQLGRRMGFPTANILLHRRNPPLYGVFAVKVHGLTEHPLAGVANLGKRPTVNDNQLLLEVHLFDFNRSIYGTVVEVEFVRKLRDEKQFTSYEVLKKQIEQDAQLARSVLQHFNFIQIESGQSV